MTHHDTTASAAARENARPSDGKFGHRPRAEAGIDLGSDRHTLYPMPRADTAREVPPTVRVGFAPRPSGVDALRYLGRGAAWRRSQTYRTAATLQVSRKVAQRGWYAERSDDGSFDLHLPDGTTTSRRLVDVNLAGPHGSDGRELQLVPVTGQ